MNQLKRNMNSVVEAETTIYTDNYICYINYNEKLCLAKCKQSGRFVKLTLAQKELSEHYKKVTTYTVLVFVGFILAKLNKSYNALCYNITTTKFIDLSIVMLFLINAYLFYITDLNL